MNAITTVAPEAIGLALPADMSFEAWAELGRDLLNNQRRADWLVADWGKHGRKHFQEQFAFIAEQAGLEAKRLTSMAMVAEAFPETCRASGLSFEVHQRIASVKPEARLDMLKRADTEHWTAKDAHREVVQWKYDQGELWAADKDDEAASWVTEMIRCWNRAPSPEDRRYAFARMKIANFGPIDEDEVADGEDADV